jgi:hypothetical protein
MRLPGIRNRWRVPASVWTVLVLIALCPAAEAGSAHRSHARPTPSPEAAPAETPAAVPAAAPPGVAVTEVRVERVRPHHEKLLTLRFLKENRDFLRSRFDRLEQEPVPQQEVANQIDPRFLAYQNDQMAARSAEDSVAAAEGERERRDLYRSVTELGQLESQLDQMDRLLADQRARLGVLQADFSGRQQTSLVILASGLPAGDTPTSLSVSLESGAPIEIPLSAEQRESLRHGGVLQIFRGLVEPRQQTISVAVGNGGRAATDPGFITLEPPRDHLTFLKLDLSPIRSPEGAPSMLASAWTLDGEFHGSGGTENEP